MAALIPRGFDAATPNLAGKRLSPIRCLVDSKQTLAASGGYKISQLRIEEVFDWELDQLMVCDLAKMQAAFVFAWTSALWTMACINRRCVSTRIWRFLPLIFLPAS